MQIFIALPLALAANTLLAPPEHISDEQLSTACADQTGVKAIFCASAAALRRMIKTSRI